ncbi:GatB/YqeY domain-containing protein [Jeotgalibacillus haloalkalitolerans]|uniref:GatB/YqeY domain-containing protein n=1 Tax=Jeotgalibacillus haloalkalitolerans TaxID=3104292 RepID=A0ABU5KM55_9BACL|nr:GatB/YqeY domain-containing protein [Jeotgalibacillus sp. HH7-29]MDZ5712214.1 GatB/YqeY domain-containing protein [Jeotgalibacillus sp. HH7-29]
MSMLDRLNEDMKTAMRSKEKERLSVIRMLKSSLQNEGYKLGHSDLSEDEELTVLSRELKQRKDSYTEFKSAGRDDLSEKLLDEIALIETYMPRQLTEEELEVIVIETINETNASSKADMGKVMSSIMPKVKGKADGARINKMVLQHLS